MTADQSHTWIDKTRVLGLLCEVMRLTGEDFPCGFGSLLLTQRPRFRERRCQPTAAAAGYRGSAKIGNK